MQVYVLFVGLFGWTEMILFSISLKTNLFTDTFQGDIPSQNVDATAKGGGHGYYINCLSGFRVNCNENLRKKWVAV